MSLLPKGDQPLTNPCLHYVSVGFYPFLGGGREWTFLRHLFNINETFRTTMVRNTACDTSRAKQFSMELQQCRDPSQRYQNCVWTLLNDTDAACRLLNATHQFVDGTHGCSHYTLHSNCYIATAVDCLATAAKTSGVGWWGCGAWDDTISVQKCLFFP